MTKEEFLTRFNNIKNPLCDKYGGFLYFLASDVLNISHMEKVCQSYGYTTNRVRYGSGSFYSEIKYNEKIIGAIENQGGFPSIEIYNRQRKHAKIISENETVIKGIKGVHGILDWHTTKGKFHILAGGQTVLHFLPLDITDEMMIDFLTKTKLINHVDEFKEKEKITLGNLDKEI